MNEKTQKGTCNVFLLALQHLRTLPGTQRKTRIAICHRKEEAIFGVNLFEEQSTTPIFPLALTLSRMYVFISSITTHLEFVSFRREDVSCKRGRMLLSSSRLMAIWRTLGGRRTRTTALPSRSSQRRCNGLLQGRHSDSATTTIRLI